VAINRIVSGAERLLDAKKRRLDAASSQRLRGSPVHNITGAFDIGKMTLPFPITGCLCVQDSPQNPCPCTDIVLWLPTFPKAVRKTKDKDSAGRDIYDFVLDSDARVFVELQVPTTLGTLERLAKRARIRKQRGPGLGRPGTTRPTGQPPAGAVAAAAPDLGWLGLAAGVGWGIGTLLDDLAGSNEGGNDNLSDDLSDWAADNFEAPDWLKDIF
jgi:hypothetical protein